ncbi:MAG: hypothetical protein R3E84_18995 [Pseudomonadales bacterium]
MIVTVSMLSGAGNIILQLPPLNTPTTSFLPFTDTFSDGVLDGWSVVNNSPLAGAWSVQNGRAFQANPVENTSARQGTYQLGTYA